MSFYRGLITAVAVCGLTTAVFAADTHNNSPKPVDAKKAAVTQTITNGKIDINNASAKDLIAVKGLNPSKVRSMVSYRKKNGNFKSLDELKNVQGFKRMDEATLKQVQDQLTVG